MLYRNLPLFLTLGAILVVIAGLGRIIGFWGAAGLVVLIIGAGVVAVNWWSRRFLRKNRREWLRTVAEAGSGELLAPTTELATALGKDGVAELGEHVVRVPATGPGGLDIFTFSSGPLDDPYWHVPMPVAPGVDLPDQVAPVGEDPTPDTLLPGLPPLLATPEIAGILAGHGIRSIRLRGHVLRVFFRAWNKDAPGQIGAVRALAAAVAPVAARYTAG